MEQVKEDEGGTVTHKLIANCSNWLPSVSCYHYELPILILCYFRLIFNEPMKLFPYVLWSLKSDDDIGFMYLMCNSDYPLYCNRVTSAVWKHPLFYETELVP